MKLINHDWQGPLCESWCCVCLASRRRKARRRRFIPRWSGKCPLSIWETRERESADRLAHRNNTSVMDGNAAAVTVGGSLTSNNWLIWSISIVYTFRTDDDRFENIPSATDERPVLDTCLAGSRAWLTPVSHSSATRARLYLLSTQESQQRAPLLLFASTSHHRGPLVGKKADKARRVSRALQQPARPKNTHVGTHRPVDAVFVLWIQTLRSWDSSAEVQAGRFCVASTTDAHKPVQISSPFSTGVTAESRGIPSTTVWHKPRRVFPSRPSSASPALAGWEKKKWCFFHNDALFVNSTCLADSHNLRWRFTEPTVAFYSPWINRGWRDPSVLTCVVMTSALRGSVRGGYSSRLTVRTPAGTLHSLPGDTNPHTD